MGEGDGYEASEGGGLDGVFKSVIRDALPVLLPFESKQGHHKSYDTLPVGKSNVTKSFPHVCG